MTEAISDELTRLRAELESHRQREVAELRAALAVAREDIAALRAEAQRISDLSKRAITYYEKQIVELKAKLGAATNSEAHARRFGKPAAN